VKAFINDLLIKDTVNHPYDSNPEYVAKIHTFYYSKDEKLIAGYWEAPEGWFDAEIEEQNEINYVIEGEIDIICGDKIITAKKGDCFLVEKRPAPLINSTILEEMHGQSVFEYRRNRG
jgi:ethanolamine utilization protein EutQ (cupin superfamily)